MRLRRGHLDLVFSIYNSWAEDHDHEITAMVTPDTVLRPTDIQELIDPPIRAPDVLVTLGLIAESRTRIGEEINDHRIIGQELLQLFRYTVSILLLGYYCSSRR